MKIVMVLTSHDELGSTGRKTGFWLEEFAAPYFVFRDAGVELTLASPKGGQPPIDPKSDLPENQTPAMARFKQDEKARKELSQTVKLETIRSENYDTVFYPGGHGPMWDLAESPASIALIELFYNSGKPVALVCHSPGVLRHVTYQGVPIVRGKRVTGFTNGEEEEVKLTKVVPFLVEDELFAIGRHFREAGELATVRHRRWPVDHGTKSHLLDRHGKGPPQILRHGSRLLPGRADTGVRRRSYRKGPPAGAGLTRIAFERLPAGSHLQGGGGRGRHEILRRTEMVRDHQPGEATFRSILPEDIDWKPFKAFPPSVRLATLVGDPSKSGPYVIRVKAPSGVKLMPHKHPEDRIYTVMSGVFYIGLGDQFREEDLGAYPPAALSSCPGTRGTSTGQSRASTSRR